MSSRNPIYIVFDPVVDAPPRGEQDVKDDAFDMNKELAALGNYDVMSDEFVENYRNIERILLTANRHRSHLFFLALYTVKHMLTDGSIHLAHPMEDEQVNDIEEYTRAAIHSAADAIVEMLTQVLFFKEDGSFAVDNEKFSAMPIHFRTVMFTFEPEEEE